MKTTSRFLQGIYPFEGHGLSKPVPIDPALTYTVPPGVTGQALYYVGSADLAHKVLAVAEEQGAARASYALKLLVTEGRLSIASTGKDTTTGKLRTRNYEVAGPVAWYSPRRPPTSIPSSPTVWWCSGWTRTERRLGLSRPPNARRPPSMASRPDCSASGSWHGTVMPSV